MTSPWKTSVVAILFVGFLVVGLGIFGRYPKKGIPADAQRIEVYDLRAEGPILTLRSEADLDSAKRAASCIWQGVFYNSLDGPNHMLVVTTKDGKTETVTFNATEWGNHGKMPREFLSFLERKLAKPLNH